MFRYYQNSKTGEVRIVRQINDGRFVVVKLISDDVRSVKFWQGDLESTASRWNTVPITPSAAQAAEWERSFKEAVWETRFFLKNLL